MRKTVRLTALLVCLAMLFAAAAPMTAFAAGTTVINVNVTFAQDSAREMLNIINQMRTDKTGKAWFWNEDNKTKTVYNTGGKSLAPLAYDYELEKVAMLRAVECAVKFSHTRPDGTDCFTAFPGGYVTNGENLAAGNSDTTATFDQFAEAEAKYEGQGHRRNMLDPSFNCIGIAHVTMNGKDYWAQAFGYTDKTTTKTPAENGSMAYPVSVLTSELGLKKISCDRTTFTLKEGESTALPKVTAQFTCENHWPTTRYILASGNETWSSADSGIAKAEGGKIVAVKAGKVKLTAALPYCSEKIEIEVTVTSTTKPTDPTNPTNPPRPAIPVTRLAGAGREATAASISSATYKSAGSVILASGDNFADALAGVPLASKLSAPILLVRKAGLSGETLNEISRLGAKNVYILGGTGAVSADVETYLRAKSYAVERIFGNDRSETAVKIAEKLASLSGKAPGNAFFVFSQNFPDALAVSGIAAAKGAPILYVSGKGEISAATGSYLSALGAKPEIFIIGGYSAIADAADSTIGKFDSDGKVERVFGDNRYQTCLEVNKKFASVFGGKAVCAATGRDFPDALAGGVFCASAAAPLVLVGEGDMNAQAEYVRSYNPERLYVFGGEKVVTESHIIAITK